VGGEIVPEAEIHPDVDVVFQILNAENAEGQLQALDPVTAAYDDLRGFGFAHLEIHQAQAEHPRLVKLYTQVEAAVERHIHPDDGTQVLRNGNIRHRKERHVVLRVGINKGGEAHVQQVFIVE